MLFWVHDGCTLPNGAPPKCRGNGTARAETDRRTAYEAVCALAPADRYVEKQGRSTGRYFLCVDGRTVGVYLKKYYRLAWWQRWLGALRDYPGPRELRNLRRVAELGIGVPVAVLAGAGRSRRCKSILGTRELEGFTPLHEYIPAKFGSGEGSGFRVQGSAAREATCRRVAVKHRLTEQLAEVVRKLHGRRLFHRDLYLCHFFVREPAQETRRDEHTIAHNRPDECRHYEQRPCGEEPLELVLIDFLRLKRSRRRRWRVKDVAQLLYSSDLPGITRSDRLRFFKRYLGVRRLDRAARRLLARVQRKAEAYRRHNA